MKKNLSLSLFLSLSLSLSLSLQYLSADCQRLKVLDNDEVTSSCLQPAVRNAQLREDPSSQTRHWREDHAHLEEVARVADGSEEVLPEGNLRLPGTGANCLQKLWKLLDELHHSRQKSIWGRGRGHVIVM